MGPTVPFWCVDAGDDAVSALRVRRTEDGALEILSHWVSPLPPSLPWTDLPRAVAALLRSKGLREHGIHLLLPGRGASCRSCRIAAEDADLPAREMERELFDLTPLEPDEAVLRWRRLGGPEVLDYRVVAERTAEVERWRTALAEAGFPHVGIGLSPVASLTALESLRLVPERGFLIEVRGTFSCLTSLEGALTVRHPIPFGLGDIGRALLASGSGVSLGEALDAPPGSPAAAALAAAAAPLGEDLRRALEYHRAAAAGKGDEPLLPLGPAACRPGLRALLASLSRAPTTPLPDPAGLPGVRLGPALRVEALRGELPALLAPLGGALSTAGLAPRDLEFHLLPEDLPAPRDRTLYPLAAALLLAALGVSRVLAVEARDRLRAGREALAAIPTPSPPPGSLLPAEAAARAALLSSLTEEARERAALRRALADLQSAFPPAGTQGGPGQAPPGGVPPYGTEAFQVLHEGGNYRVRVRLRPAPAVQGTGASPARMEPLVRTLEERGWRITGSSGGVLTAESLHMKKGGR